MPYLEPLYSVQAIASDTSLPDVAVYRRELDSAKNWIARMAAGAGDCSIYLLRRSEKVFDIYGAQGQLIAEKQEDVIGTPPKRVTKEVEVDCKVVLEEAREALCNNDLTLLACYEDHLGASAVDHSNFSVLCRRMIVEASKRDLEHFYLVESKAHECRVFSIVGDLSRVSSELQDKYLDRWDWLENSWPLLVEDHRSALAARLAYVREAYVTKILNACAVSAGWPNERRIALVEAWSVAPPGARYRFAQHLVHALHTGILLAPHKAEMFADDVIEQRGPEVIERYQSILRG